MTRVYSKAVYHVNPAKKEGIMEMDTATLSRRTFLKGSLAGLAVAGAAGAGSLYGCSSDEPAPSGGEQAAEDQIVWGQCHVNCGGRCIFQ